jgi:hypothetical protein
MKICSKCNQLFPISEMRNVYCKLCKYEYQKQYIKNNHEKILKYNNIRSKLDKSKDYQKQYRKINKDKIKESNKNYNKNRRNTDPLYKMSRNVRNLIYQSINKRGFIKSIGTENILGCSLTEFYKHIELQFEPWMNWDNWGGKRVTEINTYWDLDHIIPIDVAINEEDIIKLNHYTNLRPLCSYNNRFIKRNKIEKAE